MRRSRAVRRIRLSEEGQTDDVARLTPSERVAMMWQLAMQAWMFKDALIVLDALRNFGAALFDLAVDDLSKPDTVFQVGLPPSRIDILSSIFGCDVRPRLVTPPAEWR